MTYRLVDSQITVHRHAHPSYGRALDSALLGTLDDAGLEARLDEHGRIRGFTPAHLPEFPTAALTAISETDMVEPGSWLRFDAGGFTFRVIFKGHRLLVLEHEDRTNTPQLQESV